MTLLLIEIVTTPFAAILESISFAYILLQLMVGAVSLEDL